MPFPFDECIFNSMKTRLIYSLVALMVISLVGIIVLQTLWVSKAISDQEKEFEYRVIAALNEVNTSIDEEEARFFLEDELSEIVDVDTFEEHVNDSVFRSNESKIEISIESSDDGINVAHEYLKEGDFNIDELENTLRTLQVEVEESARKADSIILITESELNKFDNISTVVRRYVMEHTFSGDLSDRVSRSTLDSLLTKSLKEEGIEEQPEYAVYEVATKEMLSNYKTKGFDPKKDAINYKKKLFPNDQVFFDQFELVLQFNGKSGFIWSGIKWIVWLCILFTVLILVSFAYSLYFIFKQKRMSQVKNDFINNMTHELKTPLASISLAASSIQHPNVINNPVEIERFAAIIRSEEKRMNEHVERVLDMAALDYQELKMNREASDLITLLNEAMKHVELSVEAVKGRMEFSTELEKAPIHADVFHLLSAFINILDNSIKYRKEENLSIQVELKEEAKEYLLVFRDNGIGMKKAAVKRAFDKFYREETGNIHTRKGFGLGLSYVKGIIEAHEGTIRLTSEANNGTTVEIRLPK